MEVAALMRSDGEPNQARRDDEWGRTGSADSVANLNHSKTMHALRAEAQECLAAKASASFEET